MTINQVLGSDDALKWEQGRTPPTLLPLSEGMKDYSRFRSCFS